ncbi:MAG: GH92 family glycosyl hydrolase, partial [Bifidobacteriaceae bacterium]|nr:GH92 family glycosyl hydrolase [Bifidobacteriaceae bacterium]
SCFARPKGDKSQCFEYKHHNETAKPFLYAVEFNNGIQAALTVSQNTCLISYDFQKTEFSTIEVIVNNCSTKGFLNIQTQGGSVVNIAKKDRTSIYTIQFKNRKRTVIYLSQSLVSQELADKNSVYLTFNSVVKRNTGYWREICSKFKLEETLNTRLQTFYSNIYRMNLFPNLCFEKDVNNKIVHPDIYNVNYGKPIDKAIAVNNGFWDTYRTIWPLLFWMRPKMAAQLLEGVLQHYYDNGWIPRWIADKPVDSMNGTHSDIVLATAINWGIEGFNWQAALDASIKNATTLSNNPALGRKGLDKYLELGYVPNSIPEGLSWTLENSYGDWAILQAINKLKSSGYKIDDKTVKHFEKYSQSYKNVFDKNTGFFRGKDVKGNWTGGDKKFDPRVWGGDYTETNAYGTRFHPVYDKEGLIELYGGQDNLEAALDDYFFHKRETADKKYSGSYGFVIHEQAEARDARYGMFGISNQPAHHIPFVYSYTKGIKKMQKILSDIWYYLQVGSEIGQGYLGDEDNGEMSAWYFFVSLGLYPLNPVSGEFVICAPRFPFVEIKLPRGLFIVNAGGASKEYCCVKSLKVNGEEYKEPTIPFRMIKDGAHMEFELTKFEADDL